MPLSEADRSAAFSAGPPKMSRRVIMMTVAVLLVVGFGGIVADHFFPGTGSPTTPTTTASSLPAFLRPKSTIITPQSSTFGTGISASVAALMDLTRSVARPAPMFSLDASNGTLVSLSSLRGKVVVISFFNAGCNDICPVLAEEIHRSDDLLGAKATGVEFLTINTDPNRTSLRPVPSAVMRSGLNGVSNWDFLSGTVRALNPVWASYGVTISVVTTTKALSHNDVLDFIDTEGRLRFSATPFANESRNGIYSLDATTIDRWSVGISDVISSLLKGTP